MRTGGFVVIAAGVVGFATSALADTVVVNVLGHDFSINEPSDPNIEDAVISVGDTVRWFFASSFHTTTSVMGSAEDWDSGLIFQQGATYEHTFTQAGVFHYFCSLHGFDQGDGTAGGMSGTITVVPGGPTCDSVDFNNDGLFPDTLDIDDFLSVFSGGQCSNHPSCGDVDFNNDGLFPDTLDIDALLSVFAGGPCL